MWTKNPRSRFFCPTVFSKILYIKTLAVINCNPNVKYAMIKTYQGLNKVEQSCVTQGGCTFIRQTTESAGS